MDNFYVFSLGSSFFILQCSFVRSCGLCFRANAGLSHSTRLRFGCRQLNYFTVSTCVRVPLINCRCSSSISTRPFASVRLICARLTGVICRLDNSQRSANKRTVETEKGKRAPGSEMNERHTSDSRRPEPKRRTEKGETALSICR